jgi:PAS domain S-box-containing protein
MLARAGVGMALLVLLVGAVVLLDWQLALGLLDGLNSGLATMKPNTAAGFMLVGAALLALHRVPALARACAALVLVLGALTLLEIGSGRALGIDELLLLAAGAGDPAAMRMSLASATSFLLLGAALLLLGRAAPRTVLLGQALAILVALIAAVGTLGYLYGVDALYRVGPYASFALNSALLFLLAAFGALIARAELGFMALTLADDAGGMLIRRVLPIALTLPALIGWLRLRGELAGLYSAEFGIALFAASSTLVFAMLVWWAAHAVSKSGRATRHALEALRASEARFRAAVEAAPTAIVMVDAAGRIVLANPQAQRMFGYTDRELLGTGVEQLLPERDRALHAILRAGFNAKPETRSMGAGRDLFGRRKDGRELPIEIGLGPVTTAEGPCTLAVITDLTARKAAERRLHLSNEALQRSNQELQQFAYIASHDLQTPLRAIGGFVHLLAEEYRGRFDAQADDWIQRTLSATERMQTLIQDVLAYSRIDSRALAFKPTDLATVVKAATDNLEASMREAGAEVVAEGLPTVLGDASQLTQLMQNLIGNATLYRSEAPLRISIAAERVADGWQVSVSDNGIGIAPENHARIFEMFQRLHGPQNYPGTGIGLAICRRVVTRHGGRIWVESTPGAGATFRFTLPTREST